MNKPLFLTEETEALLQDCAHEIEAHAGLYLVCGERGIGKTRFLDELLHNRLDARVRWIDLAAGESSEGALVDSSELIEKTFARANPGDIIVADHFEMALKKSRHQLFLGWSTDGIDKQLSLVIGSNRDSMAELRQLAQHYQVRMQTFALQPFSDDEVAAFLGFYLFPDRPEGELSIPPLLLNQLVSVRGNIGRIIEIAERAGDQFSNAPQQDVSSQPSRRRTGMAAATVATLVLGVAGWFLLDGNRQALKPAGKAVNPVTAAEQAGPKQPSPPIEAMAEVTRTASVGEAVLAEAVAIDADPVVVSVDDDAGSSADHGEPITGLSPAEPKESADAELVVSEFPVDDPVEQEALFSGDTETSIDPASEVNAVVTITYYEDLDEEPPVMVAEVEPVSEVLLVSSTESSSDSERLRRDLDASLAWIDARNGATGTLQILLLSRERFDIDAYYEHVEGLQRNGVDISQLKIVETFTGGRETYSVLYGEYPSRQAAAEARGELVAALREAAPIARSVSGLREEIRRLGVQN